MSQLIQAKQLAIGAAPLYANTSVPAGNTVTNTAAETAFFSAVPLAANQFKLGDFVALRARGTMGLTLLSPTLRLRAYAGSTLVADSGAVSGLLGGTTGLGWGLELDLLVTGLGTSGTLEVQGSCYLQTSLLGTALVPLRNAAPVAYNSTAATTLSLTATWSAASATNTITLRQLLARVD